MIRVLWASQNSERGFYTAFTSLQQMLLYNSTEQMLRGIGKFKSALQQQCAIF